MRLYKHDELVKDTARRAYEAEPSWFGKPTWDGLEREHQNALELEARRYIDALLDAVVRLGVGQQGGGADLESGWVASSCEDSPLCNDGDFPALILKLETKP
jgi:hypothetical protein